jgi:GAF domain-containing protein
MDRALNLFLKAFPADRGLILLLTPDGEPGLKVTKFRDGVDGNREITISRTMAHQLLQKKESFLSVDVNNDERLAASQSLHDMRVYSIMGVPLMVKDKVLGMLYFDTMGSGQVFSETDLKLCSAMGLQLAVYAENTRLYTELLDATEVRAARAEIRRGGDGPDRPRHPRQQSHRRNPGHSGDPHSRPRAFGVPGIR